MHEELMRSKKDNWEKEEELLEQVEDDNNDELLDKLKKE